jgi:long-chain acyl-CoA synthetase
VSGMIQTAHRRLTLEELSERAAKVAAGLEATAGPDGATVAIMLRNDIPFIETVLAVNRVGGYYVPINWHQKGEEVNYILSDSQATHIVIHSDLLDGVRDAIPEDLTLLVVATPHEICEAYAVPPDKAGPPADGLEWEFWLQQYGPLAERAVPSRGSIVYTSGTTGRPKGVKRDAVRDEDREMYAELRRQWFGHRPGMRTAIIGPLYLSVQASYAMAAISACGDALLTPRFDAEQVLRLIEGERLTHLHLVPTMMARLLGLPQEVRQKYDLSSLEFVIHGAAPCSPQIKRLMIEWWGPIIHEYYGTSEAGMVSRASSEEWLRREGTVGRPWPGRVVKIYDAEGNVLPPNTGGEVYMSLGLMPDFTYHNAEHRRAEIERDGLITNGDIGYLDEEGYLFICDRKHDVVISGGVNIYPAEVEAVLTTHPDVFDCAVFGIPDEEFGEALIAMVQPLGGSALSVAELNAFARTRLANFKVPRRFEISEALPRDDSGKIFKRLLREPFWSQTGRRI